MYIEDKRPLSVRINAHLDKPNKIKYVKFTVHDRTEAAVIKLRDYVDKIATDKQKHEAERYMTLHTYYSIELLPYDAYVKLDKFAQSGTITIDHIVYNFSIWEEEGCISIYKVNNYVN